MSKNKILLDWENISTNHLLTEEFMEKNKKYICWDAISTYQKLSESFIERNKDRIDWFLISKFQKLSESFIEKYINILDIERVCEYQKLSEQFMERNKDRIDWSSVSIYQKLSIDFIDRNSCLLNMPLIAKYQKLNIQLIEKYKLNDYITYDSWMYKELEYKKSEISKTGLYELDGDFLYAYKAVREDYYSNYNFQYKYKIGEIYEAHADYNPEKEDSFGLSACTLERTKNYNYQDKGRILKVKVNLNNVACLVNKSKILRCIKLEVIDELF